MPFVDPALGLLQAARRFRPAFFQFLGTAGLWFDLQTHQQIAPFGVLFFKLFGALAEALDVLPEDVGIDFGDVSGLGLNPVGDGVLFGAQGFDAFGGEGLERGGGC